MAERHNLPPHHPPVLAHLILVQFLFVIHVINLRLTNVNGLVEREEVTYVAQNKMAEQSEFYSARSDTVR